MASDQLPNIRRIVTSHDTDGKAVFWIDGPARNIKVATPHVTSTLLWSTDGSPVNVLGDEDMGDRQLGLAPPPNGTRFVRLDIKPGMKVEPGFDVPGMHRTDTLDYNIVLSGEITLYLDDGASTVMKAGDVCVQRGTNHSWLNEGSEPAVLINVLMDGTPKREGSVGTVLQAKGA
ncbi:cupin domain-containing protein [Novosphingobium flavum]|uniref:Cupin domain-containing protein n=1 Tax=Novosphingobium flavum TaxID=1778672 RepID=A0A7X1KMU2_9SPHN|nr:cupin domain-containing protein [Novosphingobium flavum]MBC2667001.1 cupin domain-containing protein [Novosphingobium flavum]